MNSQRPMDERLWDFIDGVCTPEERKAIESLIANNREWHLKYEELLEVHQTMSGAELDEPSLRFTKNVMDEIARYGVAPATKSYINKYIIRGIAGFFLVMIAGLLCWILGQFHWSAGSGGSSPFLSRYSSNLQENLNKFGWSKVFNNTYLNIFLVINAILGLVLVDTFLQRKRRRQALDKEAQS